MKDFNKNDLKIGDTVVFMQTKCISSISSRSYLCKGTIIAFTEKMVSIKCHDGLDYTVQRMPDHVALIQEPVEQN